MCIAHWLCIQCKTNVCLFAMCCGVDWDSICGIWNCVLSFVFVFCTDLQVLHKPQPNKLEIDVEKLLASRPWIAQGMPFCVRDCKGSATKSVLSGLGASFSKRCF